MKAEPTYTAEEVKAMCSTFTFGSTELRVLTDLLNEELDLYEEQDIAVLIQAASILFIRSLISKLGGQ